MKKIIIVGMLICLLLLTSCKLTCNEISEDEATIKIVEYADSHTKSECLVYCDNLDFCNVFGVTQYTQKGCLRRC